MLKITVHVDAPAGQAIGIKEQIAQDLERFGDTKVVSVEVIAPEYRQMHMGDYGKGRQGGTYGKTRRR